MPKFPLTDKFVARLAAKGIDFDEHQVVRHKDGNHLNNTPDNIIMGTQQDNIHDITTEARAERISLGHKKRAEMVSQIPTIRARLANGEDTRELAREYGVWHTTMLGIANGTKYKKYY